MPTQSVKRITAQTVKSILPRDQEYTIWDESLPGFGIRVRTTGAATYVLVYRAGRGRGAPVRRYKIGDARKLSPEQGRLQAKTLQGAVASGHDPSAERAIQASAITVSDLAARFLAEHVEPKRKARTADFYRDILDRIVVPEIGSTKANKLTRGRVAQLHHKLRETPFQANRVLATIGSMYTFADRVGIVPDGFNPARRIEKYKERRRERFLSTEELQRLGDALREAETVGIPWELEDSKPISKHVPKQRITKIDPFAAAAIRLLIFTGARLSEILHLKREHIDFERGLLLLPDSKTGQKTIVLNAPALAVLANLPQVGEYVIAGKSSDNPRADLQRPWRMISKRAGLEGVRIHDLRHTHASVGAASGLGLPIIGKLLGHTQASTTQRYAHLDNNPLRQASEHIGGQLASALGEPATRDAEIIPVARKTAAK